MITLALIVLAVIALLLVVLVQGKWTSQDSWFVAVFALAVMAMMIGHYVNQTLKRDVQALFLRRRHQPSEVTALKELAAAGPRGRKSRAVRRDLARLIRPHYVTEESASMDTVVYVITDHGRRALAN
jgi:hypothetical protein